MLKSIATVAVGPAETFKISFGQRMNLITGDNGLGKSFLLDIAWWVCARDWPEKPAIPNTYNKTAAKALKPRITATIKGLKREADASYQFVPDRFDWRREGRGRPSVPGLVLYARIDGGFSVWDPARHYYKNSVLFGIDDKDRAPAFHFSRQDVWNGRKDDRGQTVSRGMIIDWLDWQTNKSRYFDIFRSIVELLSPENEFIRIAPDPVRLPGPSVEKIPALQLPYGVVPITLASAAVRRIVTLAYLIVWMWAEHVEAAQANGMDTQRQIIVLIDEIEAHLHPRWQRQILPALLEVGDRLAGDVAVQFILSTHSPLVLASAEPTFDSGKDKLFHLRLDGGKPFLDDLGWTKRGTAGAWLRSEVFGLDQDRSIPAAQAMQEAERLMTNRKPVPEQKIERMQARLADLLPAHDPFWAQWHRFKMLRSRT